MADNEKGEGRQTGSKSRLVGLNFNEPHSVLLGLLSLNDAHEKLADEYADLIAANQKMKEEAGQPKHEYQKIAAMADEIASLTEQLEKAFDRIKMLQEELARLTQAEKIRVVAESEIDAESITCTETTLGYGGRCRDEDASDADEVADDEEPRQASVTTDTEAVVNATPTTPASRSRTSAKHQSYASLRSRSQSFTDDTTNWDQLIKDQHTKWKKIIPKGPDPNAELKAANLAESMAVYQSARDSDTYFEEEYSKINEAMRKRQAEAMQAELESKTELDQDNDDDLYSVPTASHGPGIPIQSVDDESSDEETAHAAKLKRPSTPPKAPVTKRVRPEDEGASGKRPVNRFEVHGDISASMSAQKTMGEAHRADASMDTVNVSQKKSSIEAGPRTALDDSDDDSAPCLKVEDITEPLCLGDDFSSTAVNTPGTREYGSVPSDFDDDYVDEFGGLHLGGLEKKRLEAELREFKERESNLYRDESHLGAPVDGSPKPPRSVDSPAACTDSLKENTPEHSMKMDNLMRRNLMELRNRPSVAAGISESSTGLYHADDSEEDVNIQQAIAAENHFTSNMAAVGSDSQEEGLDPVKLSTVTFNDFEYTPGKSVRFAGTNQVRVFRANGGTSSGQSDTTAPKSNSPEETVNVNVSVSTTTPANNMAADIADPLASTVPQESQEAGSCLVTVEVRTAVSGNENNTAAAEDPKLEELNPYIVEVLDVPANHNPWKAGIPHNFDKIREISLRNIPRDVPLLSLLGNLNFGLLDRIHFLPEKGELRVFYVEPEAARNGYIYLHKFGAWVESEIGDAARVNNQCLLTLNAFLWNNESLPVSSALMNAIENEGATRVLFITGVPNDCDSKRLLARVMSLLPPSPNRDVKKHIEHLSKIDKDAEIRFTSIIECRNVKMNMEKLEIFKSAYFFYGPDPCGPLRGHTGIIPKKFWKFRGRRASTDEDDSGENLVVLDEAKKNVEDKPQEKPKETVVEKLQPTKNTRSSTRIATKDWRKDPRNWNEKRQLCWPMQEDEWFSAQDLEFPTDWVPGRPLHTGEMMPSRNPDKPDPRIGNGWMVTGEPGVYNPSFVIPPQIPDVRLPTEALVARRKEQDDRAEGAMEKLKWQETRDADLEDSMRQLRQRIPQYEANRAKATSRGNIAQNPGHHDNRQSQTQTYIRQMREEQSRALQVNPATFIPRGGPPPVKEAPKPDTYNPFTFKEQTVERVKNAALKNTVAAVPRQAVHGAPTAPKQVAPVEPAAPAQQTVNSAPKPFVGGTQALRWAPALQMHVPAAQVQGPPPRASNWARNESDATIAYRSAAEQMRSPVQNRKRSDDSEFLDRAVRVTGIPPDMDYDEFGAWVKGGAIDTIIFINEPSDPTYYKTNPPSKNAVIVFVLQADAQQYRLYVNEHRHSLRKGYILGCDVSLPELKNVHIFGSDKVMKNQYSRCLFMQGIPHHTSVAKLRQDIQLLANMNETLAFEAIATNGVCAKIWCTSIASALFIAKSLNKAPGYLGVRVEFTTDVSITPLVDMGKRKLPGF